MLLMPEAWLLYLLISTAAAVGNDEDVGGVVDGGYIFNFHFLTHLIGRESE